MTYNLYNSGRAALLKGLDFTTDNIKIALLNAAYTPDIDAHQFFFHVSANEVPGGNGYTAGGQTITGGSVTIDTANDIACADAADMAWANLRTNFQTAVLYKDTGNPATSPLIAYWNNESPIPVLGQNFRLQFSPTGILLVDPASFGF